MRTPARARAWCSGSPRAAPRQRRQPERCTARIRRTSHRQRRGGDRADDGRW